MPTLAGIEVDGVSIAGLETCIDLPGLRVCFDLGRAQYFALPRDTVLFTHSHMDHLGAVAWHCATRSLRGMSPPTYIVGHENAAAFTELFEAWRKLDRSPLLHRLLALGPGEEHVLPNGKLVRPFRSFHRVPCQGYAIVERRKKLRREYQGLSGEELARLHASLGDALHDLLEIPQVAFTGDTLIDVVEREEVVRKARLLVMEVTFVDERVSVEQCRDKGHVHLDEVVERADLFENEALLLTHFSERYSKSEIVAALDRRLPKHLRERVTPLLAGHRER